MLISCRKEYLVPVGDGIVGVDSAVVVDHDDFRKSTVRGATGYRRNEGLHHWLLVDNYLSGSIPLRYVIEILVSVHAAALILDNK